MTGYLQAIQSYVTPSKNTMVGAAQVMTIVLSPILGREVASFLSNTDILPDNVVGELLSGSSDLVSDKVFEYSIIGGFSLGGFFTAQFLEKYKDGEAKAGVDMGDLDIEEDLKYFSIDKDQPKPKKVRELIERYRDMRGSFKTIKLKNQTLESRDEDILLKIEESGLSVEVSQDMDLGSVMGHVIDKAAYMEDELSNLPDGITLGEEGLVIDRDGSDEAQIAYDEILSSAIAASALGDNDGKKGRITDLRSVDFAAKDAASLIPAIGSIEGMDALEQFVEGDERKTVKEKKEEFIENSMKSENA